MQKGKKKDPRGKTHSPVRSRAHHPGRRKDDDVIVSFSLDKKVNGATTRTRKSTPIVALASSSGNHCLSEKRSKRLLFPTDELPMRSSLTLMSSCECDCGVGAIVSWVERESAAVVVKLYYA
jgi:hypothetical protein